MGLQGLSLMETIQTGERSPSNILQNNNYIIKLVVYSNLLAIFTPVAFIIVQSPLLTIGRTITSLMFLYSIYLVLHSNIRNSLNVMFSDMCVLLTGIWIFLSAAYNDGIPAAGTSAAVIILEFFGIYFSTRLAINTFSKIDFALKTFENFTIAAVAIATLDLIIGRGAINTLFSIIIGPSLGDEQYRFGLMRAIGPFDQAIMYGTVCSFALISSICRPQKLSSLRTLILVYGTLLSLSSAPLIVMTSGIFIFLYKVTLSTAKSRWFALLSIMFLLLIFIILLSDDPLMFMIENFTLESETGKFRILIWQFASVEIMEAPLFGIGFRDWFRAVNMPSSIDSLWLFMTLRFGFPASGLYLAAMLSALSFKVAPRGVINYDNLRLSFNIIIIEVLFVGLTVHFWGQTWMLVSFIMALSVNLKSSRTNYNRNDVVST